MNRLTILVCGCLVAVSPLYAAQKQGAAPQKNLSGAWELNREASSPAPAGLGRDGGPPQGGRDGGHPGGPGGGGGGRGGFGMPGMGGGGMRGGPGGPGGEQDREEMQRQRDLMREMIQAQTRLVIDQDGPLVTITDNAGTVRRYTTNGKPEKHQLTSGTVETKTRWEDGALVMEIKGHRGTKVTRHFALSSEGDARQLVVTTKVEGGGGPGGGGEKRPPHRAVYDSALQDAQP